MDYSAQKQVTKHQLISNTTIDRQSDTQLST